MGTNRKPAIGFIGTGVMGRSMALNLIKAGYSLGVYTRNKVKAEDVLRQGGRWYETIADLAGESDVIITMVGFPSDVEEVYFDERGILRHAKPGTYLIDMTTSSPALAKRIYQAAKERQLHALDAPVSGGDIGARQARLVIMVGGDEEDFRRMLPVFEAMGKTIVRQGAAGAGQHTKMCNQIALASNMMGVCEALIYAKRAGLDPKNVLQTIESGAAGSWSLSNLGKRIIEGDYNPGFYVKHFIKDMTIAIGAAEEMGLMTPGLKQAKELYQQLASMGKEELGTQALYLLYERM